LPDAHLVTDMKGVIVDVNRSASQLLNLPVSDLLGRSLIEYLDSKSHPKVRSKLNQLRQRRRIRNFEAYVEPVAGTPIPVQISLSPATPSSVEPPRFRWVIRDVTRSKRLEKALIESRVTARALMNAPTDFALLMDTGGKILDVNHTFAQYHGKTPDEFIGKSIFDLTLFMATVCQKEVFDTVVVSGEALRFEEEYLGIWYDVVVYPVLVDLGRVIRVGINARDIQERKEAEAALKQYTEELRRSNEDLKRLAYISSHDLQEPIRTTIRYAQLLDRRYRGELDEDADVFLGFIVDAGEQMQEQITDLLDYFQATLHPVEMQETDSEEILEGVLGDLQLPLAVADASITSDPLPKVMASPHQFSILLHHLIENAVKFRGERPLEIHVTAENSGSWCRFSVADNGIGIEPRYFDRIFIIFQRLHPRAKYPGTGIGLALVKRIVERHGGRIWVESEPGRGSTFSFTMPAVR
ncbi:MAG TPA: ATP-binding protein, partial [Methanomicrobiales archaeon]|nr:ATP-binding protein [Methanomicrobiales archaeon]